MCHDPYQNLISKYHQRNFHLSGPDLHYKYSKHDSQYLKVGSFDLHTTQRQTNFTQICHHTVQIKCH